MCDRNGKFVSEFFTTLFKLYRTKIKLSIVRQLTKLAIKSAQYRTKHYVDNKKICELEVGYKVFLKVAPNRLGLKLDKSRKLSPRFCGPIEIVKTIRQATR